LNTPERKESQRLYYQKNRLQKIEDVRMYREKNKAKIKRKKYAYNQKNKIRLERKRLANYHKNKDAVNKRCREAYKNRNHQPKEDYCVVCNRTGRAFDERICPFCNGTGNPNHLGEEYMRTHICQCEIGDRKNCPVCKTECHHDSNLTPKQRIDPGYGGQAAARRLPTEEEIMC